MIMRGTRRSDGAAAVVWRCALVLVWWEISCVVPGSYFHSDGFFVGGRGGVRVVEVEVVRVALVLVVGKLYMWSQELYFHSDGSLRWSRRGPNRCSRSGPGHDSVGSASTGFIGSYTSRGCCCCCCCWWWSCRKVELPSTPVMCASCEFAESGVGGVHWPIHTDPIVWVVSGLFSKDSPMQSPKSV